MIKFSTNNSYYLINKVEPVYQASTNQDNAKKKNNDFAEILKTQLDRGEVNNGLQRTRQACERAT